MGSKYRLAPRLAELFATLPPGPAIDAFSGSGVVAYTLKAQRPRGAGQRPLTFTATLAQATRRQRRRALERTRTSNGSARRNRDGRDFIATHVRRPLLPATDHAFLDAAWSHVDEPRRRQARARDRALCLAAAWKQPRGVFTITTPRYDDGRRQLRMSLEELFREAVGRFNAAVFAGPARGHAAVTCSRSTPRRPRSPTSTRRTRRRATTRATSSATTSSRASRRTGAARRSCGRRARASCASATRRSRPSAPAADALDRTFDHFRAADSWSPTAPTPRSTSMSSNALLRRHKPSVAPRRDPAFLRASARTRTAKRRAATEYVLLAQ